MRKLRGILLTGIIAASLAACGQTEGVDGGNTNAGTEQTSGAVSESAGTVQEEGKPERITFSLWM